MKSKFKYLILILFLFLTCKEYIAAQDTLSQYKFLGSKRVIQLNELPNKNKASKKSFRKIFKGFVLGKGPSNIIKPVSIVVSKNGDVWFADQGVRAIVRIKKGDVEIPSPIRKSSIQFQSPVGICMLSDNNLLFTDSYLNSISIFNQTKKTLEELCKGIEFKQPTGVAYSEITKEIWLVETAAHRISVLDEQGKLIKRIGKRGNKQGEFNFPTFIWVDKLGTIYVVDSLNFRVQIFDSSGKFISAFGEQGDGTGNFGIAKGIAVDSFGNIYVADALFHAVQIFDKAGNFLHSFGSQGKGKGQFWMPAGIYIDDNNYIYVADSYNSRIQVFKVENEKE